MASFPRTLLPFEVTSLELPGPLISKAQSGRVTTRSTQQIGHTWTERYLVNVRSLDGRALLATVMNLWRNGTIFTISHMDHLTPLGAGGGSPLVNAATQLVTDPENFGAWTAVSAPTLTGGQSDPLGGTAAYLINDTGGGAIEFVKEVVAFTGNAEKAFAVYAKQGTSDDSFLSAWDATAATARHEVKVTWSFGVPTLSTTAGAGANYTPLDAGNGWWRLMFSATGVVAANSNEFRIGPTQAVAADTGTTYFFGANAWNELSPARYSGPSQPGNAATGNALYVNGATASVSNWLRAGDVISPSVASIYDVTADVSTQTNGFAIVPINPPIFSGGAPADNAAVFITGVLMNAVILEPPTFPTTSGRSSDYGELVVRFSESL